MNAQNRIKNLLLIGAGTALLMSAAACKPRDADNPVAPPDTAPPPGDSLSPPPAPRAATPIHYQCDGYAFTAQFDGDRVTLLAPGKEYVLPQVMAASGAKFENDKAMFWTKGSTAQLRIDGQEYENCREADADSA